MEPSTFLSLRMAVIAILGFLVLPLVGSLATILMLISPMLKAFTMRLSRSAQICRSFVPFHPLTSFHWSPVTCYMLLYISSLSFTPFTPARACAHKRNWTLTLCPTGILSLFCCYFTHLHVHIVCITVVVSQYAIFEKFFGLLSNIMA
jgi:hypothetical protein